MSVYLIANITIHDRDEYALYEAGFLDVFMKFDGTLLAVDEAQRTVEGEWPHSRTVLIEFPDDAAVRAFYDSDGYQAIVGHRHAAASADITIISGFG